MFYFIIGSLIWELKQYLEKRNSAINNFLAIGKKREGLIGSYKRDSISLKVE